MEKSLTFPQFTTPEKQQYGIKKWKIPNARPLKTAEKLTQFSTVITKFTTF